MLKDKQSIENIENLIRKIIATFLEIDILVKYHRIEETEDMFIFTLYKLQRKSYRVHKTVSGISEMVYYLLGYLDCFVEHSYSLDDLKRFVEKHELEKMGINWSSDDKWALDYDKL